MSVTQFVVIKYCFINCWNEIWNECWNKCCDEDLHSMKCLLDRFSKIVWWRIVEDVLKNCWRCVEELLKMCWRSISSLLKVCNVCMNFIRSFLKNNSMKMWSVILHIWIKLKRSDEVNLSLKLCDKEFVNVCDKIYNSSEYLWRVCRSIYHLNFVIKSLWMKLCWRCVEDIIT